MISWISFNKFSDGLPAFTCANAISNVWSTSLVNILRCEAKCDECPVTSVSNNGNIPILKH